MIDRRALMRALGGHGLADWVLVERDHEAGCVDERTKLRRTERRVKWQLTVHRDSPAGRGSAHVVIEAVDGNADAIVEQAAALAGSSIGPAWLTQPLAAPAAVKLEDTALLKRELVDVAGELIKKLARPLDVVATASVSRDQVHVNTRQGMRTEWTETLYQVELVASASDRSLLIRREARQRGGLDLERALTSAADDLELLARAGAPAAGSCALVLGPDALLHDDTPGAPPDHGSERSARQAGALGVWAAFANQADAVVERQGLTRYRERAPIATGADQVGEPLTITSDGALDFGLRSAPVGDEAEAVRRFALVERGIAIGLGLSPREAALRKRDPNGGVRNLVVAPGSWSGAVDPSKRVVEVRRLRSLSIDPYTGEASIEISLAIDHTTAGARPFSGGSLRIDLIPALAHARRSAAVIARGAYKGPQSVLIDRAELIA